MTMLRCMGCMEEYSEKHSKCPHCGCGKEAVSVAPYHLMPGTVLQKRYVAGRALRYDAADVIYVGWDQVLAKKIAIKEYFPIRLSGRTRQEKEVYWKRDGDRTQFLSGMEQFVSEAEQLAQYREDTGFVRIYDTFEENGTAYIVMEYSEDMQMEDSHSRFLQQRARKEKRKRAVILSGFGIGAVVIVGMAVLVAVEMHEGIVRQNANQDYSYVTLPDMTGISYQEAKVKMEKLGVELRETAYTLTDTAKEGVIVRQSVPCGEEIQSGMVVEVVVTKKEEKTDTAASAQQETEKRDGSGGNTENTQQTTTQEPVATRKQNTERYTTERTTSQKRITEKKTTEKKTTEKKTTEKKTTEKKTTENTQEVIVIED